ncbi:MAG TPA: DUF2802 domain-containing protein [Chromatiaceae bacterium]|nr:DUF2802 domain-containing protein [Chromatiaceae bacterium]HIA08259.1 DUF2802 domain-containing protein [Chromatiaceae bacterium]HIB85089.1 DUF2802 domain-containing protein [Chromatiaceae bacterium]HIN82570.1 DUF2802 domain-containing protein [Chromatiales bacterium]HIO14452.1 DUF2802 domain-containing protein [Chromatiales bacterium]
MDPVLITAVSVAGISLMVVAVTARKLGALRKQVDTFQVMLEPQVRQTSDDLAALCSAALGTDLRFVRLESRTRLLSERQDRIEHRQERDRPYGEAIRLVHDGANADDLMQTLNLTNSEAQLIVTMHHAESVA